MTLFAAAIVAGLLLGWLLGGSMETLGRSTVRLIWLAPLALAVEAVIVRLVGLDVPPWVWPVHMAVYAALLVVVAANWRLPGISMLGLGLLLNATVIALNGGLMPEAPETLHIKHSGEQVAIGQHPPHSKDVVLPRDQARLWWLGDVITPPPEFPVQLVISAGDLFVATGIAWTIVGLMRHQARDQRDQKERTLWPSISNLPNS